MESRANGDGTTPTALVNKSTIVRARRSSLLSEEDTTSALTAVETSTQFHQHTLAHRPPEQSALSKLKTLLASSGFHESVIAHLGHDERAQGEGGERAATVHQTSARRRRRRASQAHDALPDDVSSFFSQNSVCGAADDEPWSTAFSRAGVLPPSERRLHAVLLASRRGWVDLAGRGLGDAAFAFWSTKLAELHTQCVLYEPISLDVSANGLGGASISHLLGDALPPESLRELRLNGNGVGTKAPDEAIRALVEHITSPQSKLNVLQLDSNGWSQIHIAALCTALSSSPTPKLKSLSMNDCRIGQGCLGNVCNMLSTNGRLMELSLRYNTLSVASLPQLTAALKNNNSLHALDVSWNRLGSFAVETSRPVVSEFLRGLTSHPSLVHVALDHCNLDVGDCELLTLAAESATVLSAIHLSGNPGRNGRLGDKDRMRVASGGLLQGSKGPGNNCCNSKSRSGSETDDGSGPTGNRLSRRSADEGGKGADFEGGEGELDDENDDTEEVVYARFTATHQDTWVDTFEFRVCDDCWLCSRWDEFKLAYTPGPSGPDGSRLYFACSADGWRLREMTPHKNARWQQAIESARQRKEEEESVTPTTARLHMADIVLAVERQRHGADQSLLQQPLHQLAKKAAGGVAAPASATPHGRDLYPHSAWSISLFVPPGEHNFVFIVDNELQLAKDHVQTQWGESLMLDVEGLPIHPTHHHPTAVAAVDAAAAAASTTHVSEKSATGTSSSAATSTASGAASWGDRGHAAVSQPASSNSSVRGNADAAPICCVEVLSGRRHLTWSHVPAVNVLNAKGGGPRNLDDVALAASKLSGNRRMKWHLSESMFASLKPPSAELQKTSFYTDYRRTRIERIGRAPGDYTKVAAVLQQYWLTISHAYDHYAALGVNPSTDTTASMGSEMFTLFARQCGLIDDANLRMSDLDTIFIVVNTGGILPGRDLGNLDAELDADVRSFSRYEFLEALIRIAAAKFVYPAANAAAAASAAVSTATSMVKQYITAPAAPAVLDPLTGLNHGKVHGVHVPDLSEAVGTLLCRHIVPLAERCDARTWLRDRFLLEAADSLYTKYLPSLQKAFDAHSLGSGRSAIMRFPDLWELVHRTGIADEFCGQKEVVLALTRGAGLRVQDGKVGSDIVGISFAEFCAAIGHLADLKARRLFLSMVDGAITMEKMNAAPLCRSGSTDTEGSVRSLETVSSLIGMDGDDFHAHDTAAATAAAAAVHDSNEECTPPSGAATRGTKVICRDDVTATSAMETPTRVTQSTASSTTALPSPAPGESGFLSDAGGVSDAASRMTLLAAADAAATEAASVMSSIADTPATLAPASAGAESPTETPDQTGGMVSTENTAKRRSSSGGGGGGSGSGKGFKRNTLRRGSVSAVPTLQKPTISTVGANVRIWSAVLRAVRQSLREAISPEDTSGGSSGASAATAAGAASAAASVTQDGKAISGSSSQMDTGAPSLSVEVQGASALQQQQSISDASSTDTTNSSTSNTNGSTAPTDSGGGGGSTGSFGSRGNHHPFLAPASHAGITVSAYSCVASPQSLRAVLRCYWDPVSSLVQTQQQEAAAALAVTDGSSSSKLRVAGVSRGGGGRDALTPLHLRKAARQQGNADPDEDEEGDVALTVMLAGSNNGEQHGPSVSEPPLYIVQPPSLLKTVVVLLDLIQATYR